MAESDYQKRVEEANAEALQPPRMTILSDHPILREASDERKADDREDDSFELISRLGTIYDIIRHKNTRTPIAMAIYGDWGTGKSSAMRWLAEQLTRWSQQSARQRKDHFRCRTVWFEPWKFQKREDVWRGLIAEVILNSIDPKKASIQTVVSAAKKFTGLLGRSFVTALSAIKLTGSAEKEIDVGPVKGKVGGEVEIDLEALTRIAEDYQKTTHPEKAYLNEFESTLKEWVRTSLGKDERMVLFIDDLDRCLPDVVLEVLEALKLYLNIPQLVFVIGLDRDVVRSVVRKHYATTGLGEHKAASYLDKIFQVEIDVPPSERQMEGYFERQVERLDSASGRYWSTQLQGDGGRHRQVITETIKKLALHNPRETKRLLNSTLLRGSAAERDKTLKGDATLRFAQGCQVYLISRVLDRDELCPTSLLREEATAKFFAAWFRFRRDYPLYQPTLWREEKGMAEPEAGVGKDDPRHAQIEELARPAYLRLQELVPRTKSGDVYPLLDSEPLWKLMEFEFSADVAMAMATPDVARGDDDTGPSEPGGPEPAPVEPGTAPAQPGAGAQGPAGNSAKIPLLKLLFPREMLARIAKALNTNVKGLTLERLLEVRSLDLSGTQVSDLGPIAALANLQSLSLNNTQVSDLRPVASLAELQSLSLDNTQVSDLQAIAKVANLRWLNIRKTQISNLKPITELDNLKYLYLDNTHISEEQVAVLRRVLPNLKIHIDRIRKPDET